MGHQSVKNVWGEDLMINYLELYITHCSALNKGYTKRDVKAHNIAMKELAKIFYQVQREKDKSFYLELLHNKSSQVRLIAAAHCLGLNEYIAEAKKTLISIAKDTSNVELAFEAQATFDVWKKQGYLKF